MFGRKEKELQDRLRLAEEKLFKYEQALRELQSYQSKGSEHFMIASSHAVEQKQNIEELQQLVGGLQASQEQFQKEVTEANATLEGLPNMEAMKQDLQAETARYAKTIADWKVFMAPFKNMSGEVAGLATRLQNIETTCGELKEYFRNMSVLSLHAAIQAGRLGDLGKDYIATAEEIRMLSEEKHQVLDGAMTEITELRDRMSEMEQQLEAIQGKFQEVRQDIDVLQEEKRVRTETCEKFSDLELIRQKYQRILEQQEEVVRQQEEVQTSIQKLQEKQQQEVSSGEEAENAFRRMMELAQMEENNG